MKAKKFSSDAFPEDWRIFAWSYTTFLKIWWNGGTVNYRCYLHAADCRLVNNSMASNHLFIDAIHFYLLNMTLHGDFTMHSQVPLSSQTWYTTAYDTVLLASILFIARIKVVCNVSGTGLSSRTPGLTRFLLLIGVVLVSFVKYRFSSRLNAVD